MTTSTATVRVLKNQIQSTQQSFIAFMRFLLWILSHKMESFDGSRYQRAEDASLRSPRTAQPLDKGAFIVTETQAIVHHRLGLVSIGRSCRGFGDLLEGRRADHFAARVNDWSCLCAGRRPPIPHNHIPALVPGPPPRDSHISGPGACRMKDWNG